MTERQRKLPLDGLLEARHVKGVPEMQGKRPGLFIPSESDADGICGREMQL